MNNDLIIRIIHICLFFMIASSPFFNNYELKSLNFLLLLFILAHFITKYGKCGLINIEKYFLKENYRNGFLFKLIRPVISHKNNFFYDNLFWLLLLYIFILFLQLNNKN